MKDNTEVLQQIELVLSEGIASMKHSGVNADYELLLKYVDVQNKIGEIVWQKIAKILE